MWPLCGTVGSGRPKLALPFSPGHVWQKATLHPRLTRLALEAVAPFAARALPMWPVQPEWRAQSAAGSGAVSALWGHEAFLHRPPVQAGASRARQGP